MKKLAIIFIVLASFFFFIPQTLADLNDGLVSHYPLDGNANDIIGVNHGTEHGGLGYLPGVIGQAASFDGIDDHISVPSNPSLQLNTYTISAWVKLDTITWGNRIVEKGNSNSYYLYINYSSKALVGFFDGSYHDMKR